MRKHITSILLTAGFLAAAATPNFALTQPELNERYLPEPAAIEPLIFADEDLLTPEQKQRIAAFIEKFATDATEYNKEWGFFKKEAKDAKDAPADESKKKAVLARAAGLKRRAQQLRGTLGPIVASLREGKKLDVLNSFIAKRLAGPAAPALALISKAGGALSLLQEFGQRVNEQSDEIDAVSEDAGAQPKSAKAKQSIKTRFVCGLLAVKVVVKAIKGTDFSGDAQQIGSDCSK